MQDTLPFGNRKEVEEGNFAFKSLQSRQRGELFGLEFVIAMGDVPRKEDIGHFREDLMMEALLLESK